MTEYVKEDPSKPESSMYTKDGRLKKKPGRKKGGQNMGAFKTKMNAKYLREFHKHFNQHGPAAIQKVYEESPDKYLTLMAQLVPKQTEVQTEDVTEKREIPIIDLANRLASILTQAAGTGTDNAGHGQPEDLGAESRPTDGSLPH